MSFLVLSFFPGTLMIKPSATSEAIRNETSWVFVFVFGVCSAKLFFLFDLLRGRMLHKTSRKHLARKFFSSLFKLRRANKKEVKNMKTKIEREAVMEKRRKCSR